MPGARGLTRPLIVGRRFLIHGLTRLTSRVARLLAEELAEVVVVASERERDVAAHLGDAARIVWITGRLEEAFEEAGLSGSQGLLILGEDDRENLHAAVVGHAVAPAVPIVLRTLDPGLEDQLEHGLNVRRAYSVSKLAAPAFVAAALGEEVLQTVHLGSDEVTLCRVTVNPGSPLAGATTDDLERRFHLSLLARAGRGDEWEPATGVERIAGGDRILVGGPVEEVFALAVRDHTIFGGRERRRRGLRSPRGSARRAAAGVGATLLPVAAAVLGAVLLAAAITFGLTRGMNPLEAAYFTVTTAFGETTLGPGDTPLKLLAIVTAVAGAALMAVLFGYLASVATAHRLEERAGRRARRLSGHVVVAGIGTVGARVAARLAETGIAVAAVDRSPDPAVHGDLAVAVVRGDVQLPETLDRVAIGRAVSFLACTDDDVANVLACLHARRHDAEIRTVARIFDEGLAARAGDAFGIDVVLSTTAIAADAFASAATDERAPRRFAVGSVAYLLLREDVDEGDEVAPDDVRGWEREGLHLLAFRRGDGGAEPPSALTAPLRAGDAAVFAGPEAVVRRLLIPAG